MRFLLNFAHLQDFLPESVDRLLGSFLQLYPGPDLHLSLEINDAMGGDIAMHWGAF